MGTKSIKHFMSYGVLGRYKNPTIRQIARDSHKSYAKNAVKAAKLLLKRRRK